MIAWLNNQSFLLAKGDWTEFIGIIVVFGFYVIGAIAKAWSNRSQSGDENESETSPAIEMAKKYLKQKQSQGKADKPMSEWDRRQELRRQRAAFRPGQEKMPQSVRPAPTKITRVVAEQPRSQVKVVRQPQRYPEASQQIRIKQAVMKPQAKSVIPAMQAVVVPSKPEEHPKKPAETTINKAVFSLDVFFRHPCDLRSAIILKEILDKPVALRNAY